MILCIYGVPVGTKWLVAQLIADQVSMIWSKAQQADGPPDMIVAYFHPSFFIPSSAWKPDISSGAVVLDNTAIS